jgi:hypothetical protein
MVPRGSSFVRVVFAAVLASGSTIALSASPQAGSALPGQGVTPLRPEHRAAPQIPATASRDDDGRVVVRAVRLSTPLRVDGKLDEEVYQTVTPVSDFIQTLPDEGKPATERTEAWVMFDDNYIYVSGKCYDSAPPEKWTANELRRDTSQLRQNDMFGVLLDTFHDRRNGYNFYTNPLGGFADQAITDEGNPNVDWNPVWEVRTGRFEGGWTAELAIPFKSIRYRSGTNQEWGIQLRRSIRRKNEWTHLTFVPASTGGSTSIFRVSRAATLVGLDLPPASKNIDLKPYAISRLTTDRLRTPAVSNDPDGDVGLDAKVGITANLTADITVNTDFAQVEVDEQQVNLTRFGISFPEKRDFFLEGRGIFDFGRGGPTASLAGASSSSTSLTPSLFYSRRIGLNGSRVIPIDAGGRVTGKLGKFSVGVLNIQTGDERDSGTPATNFTVTRVKRDILRRSSIGVMITNRSNSAIVRGASNLAYGADAAFSFFQNVSFGGYYSRSETDTLKTDNDSYQGRFNYGADRYGAIFEYLKVGDNYNPEVGFVRRDNFKRSYGSLRFSPRPRRHGIRQLTYQGTVEYIENGAGQLETRSQTGRFAIERENSDVFTAEGGTNYELLLRPFAIARNVTIAPGGYHFNDATVSYQMGQQRRVSGTLSLQRGEFYDGTITAYGYTAARAAILKQWSVEPSISLNRVHLPAGDFQTTLLRARSDYGFSPRMFASALLQYSSADSVFSSNLRFRWEYRPGSELFVVYTDERDTLQPGFPGLKNRAFVVKVNRLFRF